MLTGVNLCANMTAMTEIRFNANKYMSAKLRMIQRDYRKRFGIRISLETLANQAMLHGYKPLRRKLNLPC